jgi:hypothetical protein
MRSGVYTWTSATPRGVIMSATFGETSWNASRSVETTVVLTPASSARVASVAITSSASQPSNSRFRYPNASTIGRKCGNCSRRRSGIGRRSTL